MRNKPKQPTGVIVAGIFATLILAGIAAVVIYLTNKEPVTPEEPTAASCCTCDWTLELSQNTQTVITSAAGSVTDGKCLFPDLAPHLGNFSPTSCTSIPISQVFSELPDGFAEDTEIVANQEENLCAGGCTFYTSDPVLPPEIITEENKDVTFTTYFELRYAIEPHTEYTEAEMIITYPNDVNSPEPIPSSTLELISTRDETGGSNSGESLPIKLYKATFDTTWDTVLNPDVTGIYTVSFRAKDNSEDEVWTKEGQCRRTFEIASGIYEGNYCYSLDAVPVSGRTPLNVTLTVDAGLPEDDPSAVYRWDLDLNCNGTIDAGEGEAAETFTTPTTTSSITRAFALSQDQTRADCSAQVSVVINNGASTLEDLSPGSCTAAIDISATPEAETCGNGSCDNLETCDTDGNISCPSETPLDTGLICRSNCTYCGDGILNDTETCDPAASQGQSGYNPNCTDECTISEDSSNCGNGVLDEGEECDPAISEGQPYYSSSCSSNCLITGNEEPAGPLSVTQQVSQCVEMVTPKNLAEVTITITNNSGLTYNLNAVSDTLPQGFAYASGSSSTNGTANLSDTGLALEMSGSSQLLTWNNGGAGWSLATGSSLVIRFSAYAGNSATVGAQTNTVTVTPADGDPIPSTANITVAQVCTQPLTGIFDRNVVIILGGLLLLFMSGAAYYTGYGTREIAKLLQKVTPGAHLVYLRITKPQKYAEEKIKLTALKNIKRRTNGNKRSR
jgi:uncharacterized repeat protein (TIGR01451 family)